MSLKAVELQIALPRTQEAGKIQEQVQYRQTHEQQAAIDQRNEQDQAMRQRTTDINETDKGQIRDKQDRQRNRKQDQEQQQKQQQKKDGHGRGYQMRDPFRGRHVDISL
ncbi:hypothetical protein [Brevibacillus migulae]|uniref:hypothetical protein n=1 Tax=Brevibacillus migulae TaxID=1644114 RepID=UPI00106E3AA4|nr:hypothetical protein [Brevibacillus migulae]